MKPLTIALILIAGVARAQTVVLHDDFNDGVLDSALWATDIET